MTEAHVVINKRRANTPNGRVVVRDLSGEDPPIVLMHGFPDDHRIYDQLLPQLSARRAVAFDFLGYGRSDRADAPGFTREGHGSEVAAVLNQLSIRPRCARWS
jgi:haloalkane dehalogenase